jgi:hypothetical protein
MADVSGKFFSAVKVRTGVSPSSPGSLVGEPLEPVNPPGGGLNSVGVTMPSAFAVANSPLTSNGTIQITGAGTIAQYVRGDGTLETFPSLTGFVPYTGATQNVDLGEFGVDAGFVQLDTTPTNTPTAQGTIFWDVDDETVDVVLNGYIMKIGEDQFYPVKNQTGSSIAKGTAVRFAGTLGASGRLLIAPFIADGSVSSSFFMGVTAEAIANGADGKVLYFGRIRGINTNAFNEGDVLYASTTVAGGFQTAVPLAPNNIVQVAAVINKSINQGVIFIRPSFGSNINQDEGVKIVSPTTGQLLQLQANGLWENKTTAQVLGGTSSQFVKGDGTLDSNTYQVTSDKGEPNGYASLDGNGKVPLVQINDALIGNVNFQGLWNAATNTPTLANPPALGTKGYYYIVSTAGTFAGISFEVGDWIISNGTAWGKVDNTDAVSSVFGRTGNVTASNGDYNTSQVTENTNLYFTNARAIASVLTGYTSGAGTISAADSILSAIQKLNGNIGALVTGVSSVNGQTGVVVLTTTNIAEGTNLYYTEARVNANTNVAANTAARHAAVTLGTANGLSLSTQQLSLGLASAGVTGALSGTDWSTFNSKQNALTNPVTGTGTSGQVAYFTGSTTISSESNLFWDSTNDRLGINNALPSEILHVVAGLNGGGILIESTGTERAPALKLYPKSPSANERNWAISAFRDSQESLSISSSNSKGSDPYSNGTTRLIINGISGNVGLGMSALDGFKLDVNGTGRFLSTLTATQFIRSGGTSSQFLKADGSVDSNTYYLASNPSAFIALTALSGTAPIQYNNTTGAISITQASGSTNGFLSSTDWNTFNNKTSNVGTVTSVAALTLGTTGTDLSSSVANGTTTPVITLNVPTASAANRGALSAADWTTFNSKENAITAGTTAQYYRGDKTFQTLNTAAVPELTNLYYTEARVNANANVAANTAARHNAVTLGTANGLSLSTQELSLGLASSSANGALSSTDWTTFNSKQNALTNPVTGTGTSGQVAYFNGTSSIAGESNLFWDATNDRLGIGTASPLGFLEVRAGNRAVSNDGILQVNSNNSQAIDLGGSISFGGVWTGTSVTEWAQISGRKESATSGVFAGYLSFATRPSGGANTERMRITSSGNLGLGVTPSAWNANSRALQLSQFVSLSHQNNASLNLMSFALETSANAFTYAETGAFPLRYNQNPNNGVHSWYTAPSGTAGNAISFTQAMTLGSNSGLSIGTPSAAPSQGLLVQGAANFNSSVTAGGYITGQGNNPGGLGGSRYVLDWLSGQMRLFSYGANSSTNGGFLFNSQRSDGTNSINYLDIASTGAATFNLGSGEMRLNRAGTSEFLKLNTFYLLSEGNDQLLGSVTGATSIYAGNGVSPRLTITSGGQVGIGSTATPLKMLQVFAGNGDGIATGTNSTSTNLSANLFLYPSATATKKNWAISAFFTRQTTLQFLYSNSSTSDPYSDGTPIMTLDGATTNVLIGTTTDNSNKLRVNGSIWADGAATLNGNFRIINSNGFNDSVNFDRTAINGLILNSSGNLILNGSTGSSRITCYGDGFFSGGIQTGNPYGTTAANWLLGRFLTETTSANGSIRVQIGSKYYNIAAEDLGTVPT